jgi:hypothetical protein
VNKNAVIIPTRGRGLKIRDRIVESITNSGSSTFILSVDTDDASDYTWANSEGILVIRGDNRCMNEALNRAASQLCHDYDYLTFMGDDHVARTKDWDVTLMEAAKKLGPASITYGNDLLAGESLPTAVLVDTWHPQDLGICSLTTFG